MFPTIVYKTPGPHACAGATYAYLGVADEAGLDAALNQGYFRTLPEAIAGHHDDDSAPTREELEAKAAELGIQFSKKTTDKSLSEKIEYVLDERAKGD